MPSLSVGLLARRAPEDWYHRRQRIFVGIGHQADGECLPVGARFLNRKINDVPAEFSPLGFEHIPIPAQVGNRCFRKIRLSRGLREFSYGPTSDHSSAGLSACPLKRLNVVIPMFGFCKMSSIGWGRMMTVSRWAQQKTATHVTNNKLQSFKGNLVTAS